MQPTGPANDNPLAEYFFHNPGRLIHKWHHYFEIYHRHFQRFRGRAPVVVEIGVFHGGSLQMWRHYFGPEARIVGVDVDPRCEELAEPGIEVVIGDQTDRAFLGELRRRYPRVDVFVDDGGHTMAQQLITFEEMYPHVHAEGVYLCEDLHTSYLEGYGGGLKRVNTFIECSKELIDCLNAWHFAGEAAAENVVTRSAHSLHYYSSILVIEKRPMTPPVDSKTGRPSYQV